MKENTIFFAIDESLHGFRLDKALMFCEEIKTRTRASQLIKENKVFLSGKETKPSQKVCLDEVYEVRMPSQKEYLELAPYDLFLDILFEDDHIIVLTKPAGLVVHPSAGHPDKTLVNALVHHTDQLSVGFNEHRPGIVHRLDKDTSGLMVVAKTHQALLALSEQFKDRKVKRTYNAFVLGALKENKGVIKSYLGRHPRDRKKFSSTKEESKGKLAITHYKVLEEWPQNISLVECQLDTGRTHQIRVHFSEKGHPILGDLLYSSKKIWNHIPSSSFRKSILSCSRIALHASELCFLHPMSQDLLSFQRPWQEQKDLIELLSPCLRLKSS